MEYYKQFKLFIYKWVSAQICNTNYTRYKTKFLRFSYVLGCGSMIFLSSIVEQDHSFNTISYSIKKDLYNFLHQKNHLQECKEDTQDKSSTGHIENLSY